MANKNKWTGERLETEIFGRDSVEHLHRYAIAKKLAVNKTVLDVASGEGYGSHILSKVAKNVIGVDIDQSTVNAASLKYNAANLKFEQGSTSKIPLADDSVDLVVSFETIEHHDEHELMMTEIKRVLKRDGTLIISTPDKAIYSDKRNFKNSFHIKELYREEFRKLLSNSFSNVTFLNQKYINGSSLIDVESKSAIEIFDGDYADVESIEIDPLYILAIASDHEVNQFDASIFSGNKLNSQEIKNVIKKVQKSTTFRVGKFLLSPIIAIKKMLG